MALVTILTTEGFKEIEDEFPYDLSHVPYGKILMKAPKGYKIGTTVISCERHPSLNRKDKDLTEFWRYLDRVMLKFSSTVLMSMEKTHPLQVAALYTGGQTALMKHELVSVISIHDYGKDTFHGVPTYYMEPMYRAIWQERFYTAWFKMKHG